MKPYTKKPQTKKQQAPNPHHSHGPKNSKNSYFPSKPVRPLVVWGKHVVESFLQKYENQKETDHRQNKTKSLYLLHILADKAGKIPGQLGFACDLAKNIGIKVITHRAESESWPLADVHEDIVHQRICLQVPHYPTEDISLACDLVKEHNDEAQFGCLGIVLDQVQDPRNFGAILRSAAFFNVKFVIYAQNRQADISPLVLKASAGGAFDVSLIPVVNINRALEELKTSGAWILGTANTPDATLISKLPNDRVWVCVLGNEGTGLRSEVLKNCDFVTKIPGGTKNLDSLNVSVAAGILMHSLQKE